MITDPIEITLYAIMGILLLYLAYRIIKDSIVAFIWWREHGTN